MKTILRWIALAGIGVCAAAALVFPAGAFSPSERILLVSQSSPGTGNDLMLRAGKYFADATATFTALSEKMGLMK